MIGRADIDFRTGLARAFPPGVPAPALAEGAAPLPGGNRLYLKPGRPRAAGPTPYQSLKALGPARPEEAGPGAQVPCRLPPGPTLLPLGTAANRGPPGPLSPGVVVGRLDGTPRSQDVSLPARGQARAGN